MSTNGQELLKQLSQKSQEVFRKNDVILSFAAFLEKVKETPERFIRDSSKYLLDTFDYFDGGYSKESLENEDEKPRRFKLFDQTFFKHGPIIGNREVHQEIYKTLQRFIQQGQVNKLILLHGPNGSSKSSTIDQIAYGLEKYSQTDEGAVYKFSWIFPNEKTGEARYKGESGPIGFASVPSHRLDKEDSYAYLDDTMITAKLNSEYKENPLFLIPPDIREKWMKEWIAEKSGKKPAEVDIPMHFLQQGLSKKNQLILETLLNAYDGDLGRVLKHIQVERFYLSKHYRVGISSVEPQMSLDAHEKQLTMDRNILNLPAFMQNISFFEAGGELVDSCRGMVEFTDMLKRPIEAFKYLLSAVEKSMINLPSSSAVLDTVFLGTTNDKHLDAFKTVPDFPSFRGRFDFVTVPYLLNSSEEMQIYDRDVEAIKKFKHVCPHSVYLLSMWAVLTRLKQPDPEAYDSSIRQVIQRLDPRLKLKLYEKESLKGSFNPEEESMLMEARKKIKSESRGMMIYEGRFGASPREVRAILQKAALSSHHHSLTPVAIFEELDRFIRDRSSFEFLQFEPRGHYHDVMYFNETIKSEFYLIFEKELLAAMQLVDDQKHEELLQRYIDNVVASIRKEKIYNPITSSHEIPSEKLMAEVERSLLVNSDISKFRESLLNRIAAYKIDNPKEKIEVRSLFADLVGRLRQFYFNEKLHLIEQRIKSMLSYKEKDESHLTAEERALAEDAFLQLDKRFSYSFEGAKSCLRFYVLMRKKYGPQKK